MKTSGIVFLAGAIVLGTTAYAEANADVFKDCPNAANSFIVLKENGSGHAVKKDDMQYQVTIAKPSITLLTDDACAKSKLQNWTLPELKKVTSLFNNYNRYVVMMGDNGQILMGRVTQSNIDKDNNITYNLNKIYSANNFSGDIKNLQVFLMEVEYKDVLANGGW